MRVIFILLIVGFKLNVLSAQDRIIYGTVINEQAPLPGVNIRLVGTGIYTHSDLDGKYTIPVKEGNELEFSFIGMKTAKVRIGDIDIINVQLETDAQQLDATIVIAMGLTKKTKAIGYAVQELKSIELNKGFNDNLAGALQGKLAGVQITPSSGAPGASAQIIIRGARSFTGNNTPLFIVNGMPIASQPDFNTGQSDVGADISNRAIDIDPNDIESIAILKGQAAAALYGIRASNGVILITTKRGKNLSPNGPARVSYSANLSFETISKKPQLQHEYAQGTRGGYQPYASLSWGPKISELPNDLTYGGNVENVINQGVLHPGMYYLPQRAISGLDPWVSPSVYNNVDDYFEVGRTMNHSVNISQASEAINYSFGIGTTNQEGIMPSTGMDRYTAKAIVEAKLTKNITTGFSANYVQTKIEKSSAASDSPLPGVFASPRNYNLKGNGSSAKSNPYEQVFFRKSVFNNPYWAAENNSFTEQTDRFYGNAHLQYAPTLDKSDKVRFTIKYQAGVDSYSTNLQDFFEVGNTHDLYGNTSSIRLYGIRSNTFNSLLISNLNWDLSANIKLGILLGNEFNYTENDRYDNTGLKLSFGGYPSINNARDISSTKDRNKQASSGLFSNLSLAYRDFLFLNATLRQDKVSDMPNGSRTFIYPSLSAGLVVTELLAMENFLLSFLKLRASIAEVGQAGGYRNNFYTLPKYSGGNWTGPPLQYPLENVNAYIPSETMYNPDIKPQNTRSYELGFDVKFLKNRLGIDYTFSRQEVSGQIYPLALAGSTGADYYVTNGGQMHTNAHEVTLFLNPIKTRSLNWIIHINYTKVDSYVDAMAPGIETITLGGYLVPQVRVSLGHRYPTVYGSSFVRNANQQIVVDDEGMPLLGGEKALGDVAPRFMMGSSSQLSYKNWFMGATIEWKNGGSLYSGTNNLLPFYGVDARTANRDQDYIFPGVKQDGSPNNVVIKGVARQDLEDVLQGISENSVFDASYLKLRELNLGYKFNLGKISTNLSVFARNFLLWSKIPNIDPESSQGNNNMVGGFEQWSMPQTRSLGMALNIIF